MFKIFFIGFGTLIKTVCTIASNMDNGFKQMLSSRNMYIVIKTKSGSEAVQYALKDGVISVKAMDHPDPDITVTFSSAVNALLMVLRPTPKLIVDSIMNAFLKDDLKIEFKAESLMWFLLTLQQLMKAFGPWKKSKRK